MLLHNMVPCSEPEYSKGPGVGCGGHAYSKDGTQWIFSDVAAYTGQVTYTDGTISPPWARERPFLLFDKLGHPSYLYTGRAYGPTNVMPAGFDYTYTMVQEVAS